MDTKLDFNECLKKKIVKPTSKDINKINSLRETAKENIKASDLLDNNLYYSKITLLYDALRKYLECLAIENGYKIYNHECYTPFLKEILKMSSFADSFDKLRILRNGINYYGKQISLQESKEIIKQLKQSIKVLSSKEH